MSSSGSSVWRWLTVVAVVVAIAANAISNFAPPAGKNNGDVANITLGGVLITPEGYAFAIWGLIYIGLIAYSIYQLSAAPKEKTRENANLSSSTSAGAVSAETISKVSYGLIGACLFQIAWLGAFLTYRFWLSVILMFGIVVCLAFSYLQTRSVRPTRNVRWLMQAPISVYFGWITVAAVLNVASALFITQVSPESVADFSSTAANATAADVLWTVAMMIVSAVIGVMIALRYKDAAYVGVVVWALCAIAVRHSAAIPAITITGIVLSVILSVLIVRIWATGKGRKPA